MNFESYLSAKKKKRLFTITQPYVFNSDSESAKILSVVFQHFAVGVCAEVIANQAFVVIVFKTHN